MQQLQLNQRNQQQNQQQNQQSQHTEASLQYRVHDEVRELKLKLPDPFNGSSKNLRNFVNQIQLVIMGKPITYSTDTSNVVLIGNLLTGPALDWFSYLFEQKDPVLLNFENFLELFRSRFEDPQITRKSAERLLTVRQGQRTVAAYASEFQLLMADAGWKDGVPAQQRFHQGLNEDVKVVLVNMDDPKSLKDLIDKATAASCRLGRRYQEKTTSASSSSAPMDIDTIIAEKVMAVLNSHSGKNRTKTINEEERRRRQEKNLCFYAGCEGHKAIDCPKLREHLQKTSSNTQSKASDYSTFVSSIMTSEFSGPFMIPTILTLHDTDIKVSALLDNGATSCYMSEHFARKFAIPLVRRRDAINVRVVDGRSLKPIIFETVPLHIEPS